MKEVKHQLLQSLIQVNVSSSKNFYSLDTEVMSYFRALFKKLEISDRALDLTRETIMLNQGNYAAWHYRRKLLHELEIDLMKEISLLNSIGLVMEKNY
jgi:protein farnesyltransferase/geranylgeranyltransferase type-1 subunit alpha